MDASLAQTAALHPKSLHSQLRYNEPETVPMGQNMAAYGHTGTGGAFAWCDRDRRMSFAYCTNFQREGPGIGPRGAVLAVAAGGGNPPSWLT